MFVYIRVTTAVYEFTSYLYRLPLMRYSNILMGLLLIVAETPRYCRCVRVSIVDDVTAFPFLRNIETPKVVMRWDSGGSINLINGCKLVRITRRGVRCIATSARLIPGWERRFDSPSMSCVALNTALCVTEKGDRFFPTDKVFVSESSVSMCVHGQGRQLVADRQTYTVENTTNGTTEDDISLCDVLDRNMDVVYDPVNNRIHTKELSDTMSLYGFMSVLILVVVILAAEALADATRSHLTHNITAWVLLTTSSLLVLCGADGRLHPFVTTDDKYFVYISAMYVITSTIYWVSSVTHLASPVTTATNNQIGPQTQRDGINAMIGSVYFAICVIYGTPDNQYVSGFFFVFLFRCMQKLYSAYHAPDEWTLCANTVLMLDVTYTVTIYCFGILPHVIDEAETIFYAAAQYVVCEKIAENWVHGATTRTSPTKSTEPVRKLPLPLLQRTDPPATTPP